MPIRYDKKTARFRDGKGKFISPIQIRKQIEATVERCGRKMRTTTEKLLSKEITLSEWTKEMKDQIKIQHTLSASVGRGGRKQMSQSDWGKVGAELKKQYQFLDKFADDLKKGRVSEARAKQRAALYSRSARTVYADALKTANKDAGKVLSRRVVHASESCAECLRWSSMGYIDAEKQPPIGSLICRSNCRCEIIYK